jgi:hypothetical protein
MNLKSFHFAWTFKTSTDENTGLKGLKLNPTLLSFQEDFQEDFQGDFQGDFPRFAALILRDDIPDDLDSGVLRMLS